MKRLAITSGLEGNKEVIKILESLGGCNLRKYELLNASYAYYIDWSESISVVCLFDKALINSFKIFTLDKFNEKYPYRVGNKVRVDSHFTGEFEIKDWAWSDSQEEIIYLFELLNGMSEWVLVEDIHPIMEGKPNEINIAEILKDAPKGTKLYSPMCGEVKLCRIDNDGYPIVVCETNNHEVSFASDGRYDTGYSNGECLLFPSHDNRDWSTFKVESQFPTEFHECGKALGLKDLPEENQYKHKEMDSLRRLLIARDAWWKADGDWQPNWNDGNLKFALYPYHEDIMTDGITNTNRILAFRTPEIRDKFHKTFHDLIEQCKELL